jgi:hypothetical protein
MSKPGDLKESVPYGEEDTYEQEKDNQRWTPDVAVDFFQDGDQLFHGNLAELNRKRGICQVQKDEARS